MFALVPDIVFKCQRCGATLAANCSRKGGDVDCTSCKKSTAVPTVGYSTSCLSCGNDVAISIDFGCDSPKCPQCDQPLPATTSLSVTEIRSTRKCPFCAEQIQPNAKICRFCHSDLTSGVPAALGDRPMNHCSKCGAAVSPDAGSCQFCKAVSTPPQQEQPVSCPSCGSTQISADKKGFGLGKAAVGGLLLGPLGLLGGFAGSGGVKVTCLKCGYTWKAGRTW